MSDIVAWLKMVAANCEADKMPEHADGLRKAANELERLKSVLRNMRLDPDMLANTSTKQSGEAE